MRQHLVERCAAKSCFLVIIFMIRPPTAQSSDSNNATDRGLIMARQRSTGGV